MKVFRTVDEVLAWRRSVRGRVAFVPTMGSLHDGHLSLMREGRRRVPTGEGALVISIFVNPTQFDRAEDLAAYPRDEEGDLDKARSAGVDVAFCPPDPRKVFPPEARTWVEVQDLDQVLCGARRPGHFRGVCTVVTKLWNLVRPDVGLFGQKDYQQLAILTRMHADLHLVGEIVGLPTVRDPDGLAMSSRNANLTEKGRTDALAIPRYLEAVQGRFAAGVRRVADLLADPGRALAPGQVNYVEIVDARNLQPLETIEAPALCAVAVHFDGVRLIDNTVLEPLGLA